MLLFPEFSVTKCLVNLIVYIRDSSKRIMFIMTVLSSPTCKTNLLLLVMFYITTYPYLFCIPLTKFSVGLPRNYVWVPEKGKVTRVNRETRYCSVSLTKFDTKCSENVCS